MIDVALKCAFIFGAIFYPLASENRFEFQQIQQVAEEAQTEGADITDPENQSFYSLSEYNEKYSSDSSKLDNAIDVESVHSSGISPLALSAVKYKTAQFINGDGEAIGSITLKYQTEIQGGRPQFVYDTCFLGQPTAYNGWGCTDSHVTFSGDLIKVYATFISGPFEESGVASFTPY